MCILLVLKANFMEEGPKCPNCGRTLSYLKRVCSESIEYELSEDGCYERAENSKEECTGFVPTAGT